MKPLLTLIVVLLLFGCNQAKESAQNYCGATSRLSASEIHALPLYYLDPKITLISFAPDQDYNYGIPRKGYDVDLSRAVQRSVLTDDQSSDLIDLLVNSSYMPGADSSVHQSQSSYCYNPRNAIVFHDKRDSILGYIEICFECHQFKSMPENTRVGNFCDEKFQAIGKMFHDAGVGYGFDYVEKAAAFPGGLEARNDSIQKKLRRHDTRKGDVFVNVTIDATGNVAAAKVIKGICAVCDQDVIEAVMGLPRWVAATDGRKNIDAVVVMAVRY